MDLHLENKITIVTGGANGIGRSICEEFVKEGSKVIIGDIDKNKADNLCFEINKKYKEKKAYSFTLDVTDINQIKKMKDFVVEKFGQINNLVNCAGLITINQVRNLTEEEWDKIFDVNIKGVFLCSKIIANEMINNNIKGNIINISSKAGKTGQIYEAHYSASKAAVNAFTQALSKEVAKEGINVNAVCPGSIENKLNKKITKEKAKLEQISWEKLWESSINSIPLGRKGKPEEIAKLVVILASNVSDYITGQAINISGGAEVH